MPWADPLRPKILYAGQLGPEALCLIRCLALEDLEPTVVRFDFSPFHARLYNSLGVWAVRKVLPRLFLRDFNKAFVRAVQESRPDIVYVDKGILFTERSLLRARDVRSANGLRPVFLHFHPDDAFGSMIYSGLYETTLQHYDCHFTPYRWVLEEHVARGARRVESWPFGFYPPIHAPVPAGDAPAADLSVDVAFIGRWERTRAAELEALARHGVGLGVWGTLWKKLARRSALRRFVRWRSAVGRELAAVASLSKISLGFLSETNRNGHTSRTFEIPACGGFMLAQRSDGQREFFEEGVEMECFGSSEELHDKVAWYLAHEAAREKIRAAGRQRCLRSNYSYHDRFRFVLRVAEECREAMI